MVKLWVLFAVLTTGAWGWGYPTSANFIPTADMLDVGDLRCEVEQDGAPMLFGADAENYLLLQYAPAGRLEIGVDLYNFGDSTEPVLNTKWLAICEQERRPALALGILEFGSGYAPVRYAVATKDIGDGRRLHLGTALCEGERALMLGGELPLGERALLLADWTSWQQGYRSLGLCYEVKPGLGLNLVYAWPNHAAAGSIVVLNLSQTVHLR